MNIKQFIAGFKNKPRFYNYRCFASGTVCVLDKWGEKPTMECPYYNGFYNCGYKGCHSATIKGWKQLTENERVENNLIDRILIGLVAGNFIKREGK